MIIKFPKDTLSAATTVSKVAALESLALLEADLGCKDAPAPQSIIESNIDFSTGEISWESEGKALNCILNLQLKYSENTSEFFFIKTKYKAKYILSIEPPPEDKRDFFFGSFAKTNALFNIWPFWREFVRSSMDKFNLPYWQLPLLQIRPEDDHTPASDNARIERPRKRPKKATIPKN